LRGFFCLEIGFEMGVLDYFHAAVNWVLTWMGLMQKRQVGWKSFNRKVSF